MSEDLVVGRLYRVVHRRKGTFTAKLLSISGSAKDGMAEVEIVDGEAKLISSELNNAGAGEVIRVGMDLCRFEAV